jgi:hypothetical protein
MARGKYNKVLCDVCGFSYPRTVMKKNSYNLWVCPQDNERGYDLVNHPQNKIISTIDRSMFIRDARPEFNNDRNLDWEATVFDNWEDLNKNWNII